MAASASGVWLWKEEPASPLLQLEADSWLNASDNVAVEVELTDEVKASRAEHASKLLQDLDQWTKEEEPFPDWLEEKIDLPIFEELPPPLVNSLDMINPLKPTIQQNTLDMVAMKPQLTGIPSPLDIGMKQMEGIEVVGIKQLGQPGIEIVKPQMVLPMYTQPQQMEQTPIMQDLLQDYTPADTLTPPDSPRETDLVFTMLQEMQPHELDELVRMRVESLVESQSPESLQESESVASPSTSDSCYSDPEWTMASTSELKMTKRRRVTKPYSRTPPEEKRLRKKEQNKNAATRYRLKKKQEIEEILGEEKQLQQRNETLKTELTELGREIKYLKNLMRDLFRAKGLIK